MFFGWTVPSQQARCPLTGRWLPVQGRLEGAVPQLRRLTLRPLRGAPVPQRPPRHRQLLEPRGALRLLARHGRSEQGRHAPTGLCYTRMVVASASDWIKRHVCTERPPIVSRAYHQGHNRPPRAHSTPLASRRPLQSRTHVRCWAGLQGTHLRCPQLFARLLRIGLPC